MSRVRALAAPLLVTALAAAAMRLAYAAALARHPELAVPVLDGAANLGWARGLLAGTWPGDEPFFRPPGYLVALAGLLRVAGDDPARVLAWQLSLGTVTPVLVALLAARAGGAAAAWVAGLGAAAYPAFLFFDAQLLAPFVAVPLFAAGVLCGDRARKRGAAGVAAAAGALCGVAGVAWPLVLPVGAWLAADLARRGRRTAALAAGAALLLPPLLATAHNVRAGDPSFIASQGGLNLYLGNGPAADGMSATFPDAPTALGYRMVDAAARIAEAREGRPLRPSQVSAHWTRRTLEAVADDPGRWLALLGRKAVLAFGAREIPNNHDLALFEDEIPLLRGPGWGVWLPLAAAGVWLRRRDRSVRWLAAAAGITLLAMIAFFVNDRFRVPAAPFVVALGGVGVVALVREVRARAWRAAGAAAGIAAAFAVLAHANPFGIPARPWVVSYLLVAEAERGRGEPVRALRWIDRALEEEPAMYAARLARIELLRRAGRVAAARAEAERALAAMPGDAALRHEHAILLDLSGDPAAALAEVERAIAADPTLAPAHVSRAVILHRLGRDAEAVEALRAFLAARPDPAEAARARELLAELGARGGG